MNEEQCDHKKVGGSNIRIAIILGLIALSAASIPFFALRNIVVPG